MRAKSFCVDGHYEGIFDVVTYKLMGCDITDVPGVSSRQRIVDVDGLTVKVSIWYAKHQTHTDQTGISDKHVKHTHQTNTSTNT